MILLLDERVDKNYSELRARFQDYLVEECGYLRYIAEESDDGREERCADQYNIYLEDNS